MYGHQLVIGERFNGHLVHLAKPLAAFPLELPSLSAVLPCSKAQIHALSPMSPGVAMLLLHQPTCLSGSPSIAPAPTLLKLTAAPLPLHVCWGDGGAGCC